jgi:hypothetical protein
MRFKAVLVFVFVVFASTGYSQMVSSDQLKQDPAMLKLCIDRSRQSQSFGIGSAELIPFAIDKKFVERERQQYPDITFFASTRGLVECTVTGTGKYGPLIIDSGGGVWKSMVPMPPMFKPSIETAQGSTIAGKECISELPAHSDLANFDHALFTRVYSVGYLGAKSTDSYNPSTIAGTRVESCDVIVNGSAYFKAKSVDQTMLLYACLYSPMLELKAVGWGSYLPGAKLWLKSARLASSYQPSSAKGRIGAKH